jgi:hypothetical protein
VVEKLSSIFIPVLKKLLTESLIIYKKCSAVHYVIKNPYMFLKRKCSVHTVMWTGVSPTPLIH